MRPAATHRATHRHGRHDRRHCRDISTHIGKDFGFESQEFAIAIERKASPDEAVAAMRRGNEVLAAVPDPLHRAADAARRPQHQHPFRIKNVLHPEAAADIGNTDAKFFARDPEHRVCEQIADHVRAGG